MNLREAIQEELEIELESMDKDLENNQTIINKMLMKLKMMRINK